jgi:hypothetical protein
LAEAHRHPWLLARYRPSMDIKKPSYMLGFFMSVNECRQGPLLFFFAFNVSYIVEEGFQSFYIVEEGF